METLWCSIFKITGDNKEICPSGIVDGDINKPDKLSLIKRPDETSGINLLRKSSTNAEHLEVFIKTNKFAVSVLFVYLFQQVNEIIL